MKKLTRAQNLLIKQIIVLALLSAGIMIGASVIFANSSWVTGAGHFKVQEIPFSHQTHVSGVGLDCEYCHTGVRQKSHADFPSTETCLGCHQEILKEAGLLNPVRLKKPLRWNRVNELADHVHFNHSAHVTTGISCTTCHGEVSQMPLMAPSRPFSMKYCLDCHRTEGPRLQDCYTCHR